VGEVRAVSDMHQRKAEMARQADAFIALPGCLSLHSSFSLFLYNFYSLCARAVDNQICCFLSNPHHNNLILVIYSLCYFLSVVFEEKTVLIMFFKIIFNSSFNQLVSYHFKPLIYIKKLTRIFNSSL
jgi:hypothetical protein